MFKIFGNLTKAAVALTIGASTERGNDHPFNRTTKLLNYAGKNVIKAIDDDA